MQATLKKLIHRLLCNNITGSVIYFIFSGKIPDLRWRGFKFILPASSVNKRMVAAVFWGFYESSEIRFIEKYLRADVDVIELGSSAGIVSSHVASKLGNNRHFIMVEANPNLIATIKTNVTAYIKKDASFDVLNYAVGYGAPELMITITSNNTETRVVQAGAGVNTVVVKTISFAELVKRNGDGDYALISDIEGSEVEVLLKEAASFNNCRQLFIELHETVLNNKTYTVKMLIDIITGIHGFSLKDQHGPVVYFTK
jgi:FkbM family methyltransferase